MCGLVFTLRNVPPSPPRSTCSATVPPALPDLTEKPVTVPLNGATSAGAIPATEGMYVQVIPAAQMFPSAVPSVFPSVTANMALPGAEAAAGTSTSTASMTPSARTSRTPSGRR